jgi:predicted ribosomally synthesized peptide with nif11-like leader
MAEAAARQFVDKLEHDKALREELKSAKGDYMTVAKNHHFEFTKEELQNHLKSRWRGEKPPIFDEPNLTCLP